MYRDEDAHLGFGRDGRAGACREGTQLTLHRAGRVPRRARHAAAARARHPRAARAARRGDLRAGDTRIELAPTSPQPAARGRRERWVALYVLCAGMLMIVLDVTVVNVALPSIQEQLHFSSASPRLGRERLPDLLRRAAAARGPARRPDRPPPRVPRRASALFTLASLLCGRRRQPGAAGRRRASSRASAAR